MKTREEELWKLWKSLWDQHENTEVEYDEATGRILLMFATEIGRAAVNSTLDEALNSGDGTYKP